jgi:CPA2 family monovalent cation:H+ antiporter-2/glutathione-regulated potassium-efflux system protein KefB
MAGEAASGPDIAAVVTLLGAAVVAVPLFRRLGLGSVLGYVAGGLVIGPFGLGVFSDPEAILHVAELGVVLFLFVIGLEMQPSRLWAMRGQIFGLGLAQLLVCIAALSWVGVALGYPLVQSFIAGTGFVLTSTAIVMQTLAERRQLALPPGQRIVSILLLEDLAIVPLLALVVFLAPGADEVTLAERATAIGLALASVAGLLVAGRYLLNPMFRLLASLGPREVMTAAALLVVLGSALAMQAGGLSTAMGAFLAGVLLSESSFRHQLEADVEPFRGLLLGLFFLAVGMSLDLSVIAANWSLVAISVVALMVLKSAGIYAVARAFRAPHREALERAVLMAQGGEFAFVLYAAATTAGIFDGEANAILTAIVIVSMVLTPLLVLLHDRLRPAAAPDMDGMEGPDGLAGTVLLIGFGRFGQLVSQPLLARGYTLAIIDTDTDMIRAAQTMGFKVYFGDGTRLDILDRAGAATARAIAVCTDEAETTTRIVHLLKAEYPLALVVARAYDRRHAIELLRAGTDFVMREAAESAYRLGAEALKLLGEDDETIAETLQEVRRRDADRFALQQAGDMFSGRDLLLKNAEDIARQGH